ncbi:MAG: VWA domain-containing protein [Phycisphaerae bacterium]|nr:VWA domain-containing protein [Phycisphaerae bacterium]
MKLVTRHIPTSIRWSLPVTGWGVSILIHGIIIVLFLVVAPIILPPDAPHETPRTTLESQAEILELEPLTETLTPDSSDLLELMPSAVPPPAMVQVAAPIPPKNETIAALGGSPGGGTARSVVTRPFYPSSFGGISGSSDCICYIIDRSGSMILAEDYVRKELRKAISALSPAQYFQLVFFAGGEPKELQSGSLIRANATHRHKGLNYVNQTGLINVKSKEEAWKGVVNALRRGFEAKTFDGRYAQLFYLFTDGEFDHDQVSMMLQYLQARRQYPATIHVIACGSTENKKFLDTLARENHGRFRFVTDEELCREE